jgi:chemotaxis protein MotA
MDSAIIIGLLIVVGILFSTIGLNAGGLFFSEEAFIVVFGGLISASLVLYPLRDLMALGPRLRVLFLGNSTHGYRDNILLLLRLSHKMHTQGRSSLEKEMETIKDSFIYHAVALIVANYPPDQIKLMLKEMIESTEKRHEQGIYYFEQLAKFAPGFALVGTLIGLVKLLSNISDPKNLGPSMATALVSTFYGVSLANLVFLPLAGRLRVLSYKEQVHKEVLIEGIVSMAQGELPYVVKEKIYMLVTDKDRAFLRAQEQGSAA